MRTPEELPRARCVHYKKEMADVFIGRPSIWGNPYVIGVDGTRGQVIEKYRQWLLGRPELLAQLPRLRGLSLGCTCKPRACHGDVLVALVNALDIE